MRCAIGAAGSCPRGSPSRRDSHPGDDYPRHAGWSDEERPHRHGDDVGSWCVCPAGAGFMWDEKGRGRGAGGTRGPHQGDGGQAQKVSGAPHASACYAEGPQRSLARWGAPCAPAVCAAHLTPPSCLPLPCHPQVLPAAARINVWRLRLQRWRPQLPCQMTTLSSRRQQSATLQQVLRAPRSSS